MALNRKDTPVAVDKQIDNIQVLLWNELTTEANGDFSEYESYHRVYKNEETNNVKAESFVTGNDYKDVFMDDSVNVSSFFISDDTLTIVEGHKNRFSQVVSVIFQANLKKLYPNIPHRADEEFRNEISNALSNIKKPSVVLSMVKGIDNVYSEFDRIKIKEKQHDLQPYHVVRVDIEVTYDFECCPTFSSGVGCTLTVDVTGTDPTFIGGSDGTATATPDNGTPPYTYLWNDGLGQTTQTAVGLEEGTYTCIVTDSESCEAEGSVTLNDPIPVLANYLLFNGVNQHVSFSSSWNVLLNQDFTITYEFNTSNTSQNKYAFSGDTGHYIYHRFFNLSMRMNTSTGVVVWPYGSPAVDTWHKVIIVRIVNDIEYYLNGSKIGSTVTNNGSIQLDDIANKFPLYSGGIDNVAMLAGVGASALQISQIQSGNDFISVMGSADIQYLMNESGSTMVAPDTSGNSNDGSLINYAVPPPEFWIAR